MRDPHDPDEAAKVAPAVDSHETAPQPRRKDALPDDANRGADEEQNGLDVPAAVPLHVRPVLTYAEVAAVGIAPERTLRRLVAIGRVKRSVLRLGRNVRFVVQDLLDELRQVEE